MWHEPGEIIEEVDELIDRDAEDLRDCNKVTSPERYWF